VSPERIGTINNAVVNVDRKEIDAAIEAIRHPGEDGAGRRHLSDSSVYSVD